MHRDLLSEARADAERGIGGLKAEMVDGILVRSRSEFGFVNGIARVKADGKGDVLPH